MKHIETYQVFPKLPPALQFLSTLAGNIWWSWKQDAIDLFRRIDQRLWEASENNPIIFATRVSQERLIKMSKDDSFLAHLERVRQHFNDRTQPASPQADSPYGSGGTIAYFSMEFGIHESLPLFAGGLGVLAGDHLKSASHLGLPLVGMGLLYRQGYFRQYLDMNGWQQEAYPETDLYHLPISRPKDEWGNGLRVSVNGPLGEIQADVWKLQVGRVPLFLLDTNLVENSPEIRDITSRLYAGEPGVRLAQEILLGIGGMQALAAMGIQPTVCHMNEGHSAFANIERLAQAMERYQIDLRTAMEIVPRTSVFTTHTPVAAGHDEFDPELVRPYIKPLSKRLGIDEDTLLSWGRSNGDDPRGPFSMFILGLRFSQYCNGVSRLHGQVARRMWSHVWPQRLEEDVPISSVTNGVHISSFIAPEMVLLFERYLGPEWYSNRHRTDNIERIDEIYDEELWRTHEMCRTRLITKVRELMLRQYGRRNAPLSMMNDAEAVLDPDVLTIGFARRFATYKRSNLIFRDPDRLEKLLNSRERPIQIIFAGKAHPKDNEGKALIQNIVQFAHRQEVRKRIVFLEDYDMHVARHLIQGVDVWLNTPRRPLEACGTSGMKAAANGVLNLSILDGWWCEGYTPERGWSIGGGEEYIDSSYQDSVESQALYNILENDVIPCFYNRTPGNTPVEWIAKMKASMKMALADFCSHRMVGEYEERFYLPAARRLNELTADGFAEAKRLSRFHQRLREHWNEIRVEAPRRNHEGPFQVDDQFQISTIVHLGKIEPEEVDVEVYYGQVKRLGHMEQGASELMDLVESRGDGQHLYRCTLTCRDAGRFGLTVRVLPRADDWVRYRPGLLTWA